MALILRETAKAYNYYVNEASDQRTKDWPLLASPVTSILIVIAYMWFVKVGGPALMKNREPFKLDTSIQIYNLIQIIVTGILAIVGFLFIYGPWGTFNWFCDEIDYSVNDATMMQLRLSYVYFLTKILDLMDTVFFILRKKTGQISFLHVYHHSIMVLVIWWAMRFLPGGHGVFVGILNSFVHSVMYFYYFISNVNSEYKKSIWWKKYITLLQIGQFFLIIIHNLQMLVRPTCNYPKFPILILMPQNLFILFMFLNFYKNTYLRPAKKVQ